MELAFAVSLLDLNRIKKRTVFNDFTSCGPLMNHE